MVSVPCDVAEAADVQRLMNVAKEQLGRIDLVICNAGTAQPGPRGGGDFPLLGKLSSALCTCKHIGDLSL